MKFDKLNRNIDRGQIEASKLDDADAMNPESAREECREIDQKVDRFQNEITQSKLPAHVKKKQLSIILDTFCQIASLPRVDDIDGSVESTGLLDLYRDLDATVDQLTSSISAIPEKAHLVKKGDSLWRIVAAHPDYNFKQDPEKFNDGLRRLEEYRSTHGSVAVIDETGALTWQPGIGPLEVNEVIDLSVLDEGEDQEDDLSTVAEEAIVDAAETLDLDVSEFPEASELLADLNLEDFPECETAEELSEYLASATEEEASIVAQMILDSLRLNESPILSQEQVWRLEQVDLLRHVFEGMANEYGDKPRTMSMWAYSLFQDPIMRRANQVKMMEIANITLGKASQMIMDNPDLTLADVIPGITKPLSQSKGLYVPNLDFKDPQSEADLDAYKVSVMNFLRRISHYDAVREIGESALSGEIENNISAIPEEEKESLTENAIASAEKLVRRHIDSWKKENLTADEIDQVSAQIQGEYVERALTQASMAHINTSSLTESETAIWDVYNETFDPNDEWLNMTDAHFDQLMEEVCINTPLMIGSFGVGLALRGVAQKGVMRLAHRMGIVGLRAAVAKTATGIAVMGTSEAYAYHEVKKTLKLEDKHFHELQGYQQFTKVLFGMFDAGIFASRRAIMKSVDRVVTPQVAEQSIRQLGSHLGHQFSSRVSLSSKQKLLTQIAKITVPSVRKTVKLTAEINAEAALLLLLAAAEEGIYTFEDGIKNGDPDVVAKNLQAFTNEFPDLVFQSYSRAISIGGTHYLRHKTALKTKKAINTGHGIVRKLAYKNVSSYLGVVGRLDKVSRQIQAKYDTANAVLSDPNRQEEIVQMQADLSALLEQQIDAIYDLKEELKTATNTDAEEELLRKLSSAVEVYDKGKALYESLDS